MDFFANINGVEHKLVQGFTISEEYNETLDSATIVLSALERLNIKPYEDVFIYGEWVGVYDEEDNFIPLEGVKFNFKGYPVCKYRRLSSNYTEIYYMPWEYPYFYKHFLINQFNEEILILNGSPEKQIYKYTIELFSETKGLETIQLPNHSVTQPVTPDLTNIKNTNTINEIKNKFKKTRTVEYVRRFLNLYNKDMKIYKSDTEWHHLRKYSIAVPTENKKEYLKITTDTNFFDYDSSGFIAFQPNSYYIMTNYDGMLDDDSDNLNIKYLNDRTAVIIPRKNVKHFRHNFSYEKCYFSNEIVEEKPTNCEYIDDVFGESFPMDFTLTNPTMRDVLSKLFVTKDCYPVVVDDLIYVINTTKRNGLFNKDKGKINYVYGSLSSANYCTDLKTTYSDALPQDKSAKLVELLGFRNRDSMVMTYENMRIETRFPIYKINKMYMCYYKSAKVYDLVDGGIKNMTFLCKQDITSLVKLNSERSVLSEDIAAFNAALEDPKGLDITKFKYGTIGYDIGTNNLSGWGEKYSFPKSFWEQSITKSFLENVFLFFDRKYPYGIYDETIIVSKIWPDYISHRYLVEIKDGILNNILIPSYGENLTEATNAVLRLKHLLFEIEYQPFYNGTIIHSKSLSEGNVTVNDNQSSALALLDLEGVSQREKINRFGNKGYQINARYTDIGDLQNLASTFIYGGERDIVIYHKQYSVNANAISCTYYGAKDYILKNFYTSVYAKHRTYNLMSYGESVSRAENIRNFLIVTKNNNFLLSDKNEKGNVNDLLDLNNSFKLKLFSFWKGLDCESYIYKNFKENNDKINYGYFTKINPSSKRVINKFASDISVFSSGNSFCINLSMIDNIVSGTSIESIKDDNIFSISHGEQLAGSRQRWLPITDDSTLSDSNNPNLGVRGEITTIGIGFGHTNENTFVLNNGADYSENVNISSTYSNLFSLPLISKNVKVENEIYLEKDIYKDNKDRLDITIQIEAIPDKDVFLSPWFFKLSDLFSTYEKFTEDINKNFEKKEGIVLGFKRGIFPGASQYQPTLLRLAFSTTEEEFDFIKTNHSYISGVASFNNSPSRLPFWTSDTIVGVTISLKTLINYTDESNSKGLIFYATAAGSELVEDRSIPAGGGYHAGKYVTFEEGIQVAFAGVKWKDLTNAKKSSYTSEGLTVSDENDIIWIAYLSAENLKSTTLSCYPDDNFTGGKYFTSPEMFIGANSIETSEKNQNLYWVVSKEKGFVFEEWMANEIYTKDVFFKTFNTHTVEIIDQGTSSNNPNNAYVKFHHQTTNGDFIMCFYKTDDDYFNFVFGFKANENSNKTEITLINLSYHDTTFYDANRMKLDLNQPYSNEEVDEKLFKYTNVYSDEQGFYIETDEVDAGGVIKRLPYPISTHYYSRNDIGVLLRNTVNDYGEYIKDEEIGNPQLDYTEYNDRYYFSKQELDEIIKDLLIISEENGKYYKEGEE